MHILPCIRTLFQEWWRRRESNPLQKGDRPFHPTEEPPPLSTVWHKVHQLPLKKNLNKNKLVGTTKYAGITKYTTMIKPPIRAAFLGPVSFNSRLVMCILAQPAALYRQSADFYGRVRFHILLATGSEIRNGSRGKINFITNDPSLP